MMAATARPSVLVASRIVGLREAVEARGLSGDWLQWMPEPSADALQGCEVLVGEPAACAPLVGQCPNLRWMQSTFAGCNQLLDQPRRDFKTTRLAGCFGPDMAEYSLLHILAQERQFAYQLEQQRQRVWVAARNAEGASQGGAAYRRLSTLTLGVLGLGDSARAPALSLPRDAVGCRQVELTRSLTHSLMRLCTVGVVVRAVQSARVSPTPRTRCACASSAGAAMRRRGRPTAR
jgi:hypothetical protein